MPFVTIEIRGARIWGEADWLSGSRLVNMHSVNLKKEQVHPIWMAPQHGGLRDGERKDEMPWTASKEKQRGFVKSQPEPQWPPKHSLWSGQEEAASWMVSLQVSTSPGNQLSSGSPVCLHLPTHPFFKQTTRKQRQLCMALHALPENSGTSFPFHDYVY